MSTKRKQVKIACMHCRKKHIGCDKQRPCSNCVKHNVACIDPVKTSRVAALNEMPEGGVVVQNDVWMKMQEENKMLRRMVQKLNAEVSQLEAALEESRSYGRNTYYDVGIYAGGSDYGYWGEAPLGGQIDSL